MEALKWLRWPALGARAPVVDRRDMWQLEKRDIQDLKKYLKNPRTLTKREADKLKESLSKFGVIDKPIINADNTIIGGHQRISVLEEMGYREIECWVPTDILTEKEVEELNIRLNRNHGEWDLDILANEFDEDDLIEWGFTEFEIPSPKIGDDDISSPETCDEDKCPTCNQKLKKSKKK